MYEMATAHRPFLGETSLELSSSILPHTPKPMRELRPELPTELQRIVDRLSQRSLADLNLIRVKISAPPMRICCPY